MGTPRPRLRSALAVAGVTLLASACGAGSDREAGPATASSPTSAPARTSTSAAADPSSPVGDPPRFEAPPAVTVTAGGDPVDLEAWTYCFGSGCADGAPPASPPDVGAGGEVHVSFPLEGWAFEADFVAVGTGGDCPRHFPGEVVAGGDGAVVHPAGPAGTYDVTLFGRGDGGDLVVTFRWTTPSDGPLPGPQASAAVLADHDGTLDSYGVELHLGNLRATPAEASASITVRSAAGVERTIALTRVAGCRAEGSVDWSGPADAGKAAAAALGAGPYTYEVVVTLDGVAHRAVATWPDDQVAGQEPSVPLTFSPPLPAMG